ncbi:NDP-hexose 2,3-dehydratase family protein [Nocardia tengchongensis]|uniref:NDP-hexose 2,3-dehydratase family protein n=1 Tax=Nocardia tengchongensis TaxID=2055889 RepID=UPI0034097069
MIDNLSDFNDWFSIQQAAHRFSVRRVPLADTAGWIVEDGTANVRHLSGRFFSVQGVHVETNHRDQSSWRQPIIVQPEIGILGMLIRVVGRRVYCLMQAKMEPGNINHLQLSPTVQATRSNYTGVHGGLDVPYLDHFRAPRRGRVIFDALQSEQGSWFLKKRNRNIVIEVESAPAERDGYCWLSTDLIAELLLTPNLVNMDSRAVLCGVFHAFPGSISSRTPFRGPAVHPFEQVLSWFCDAKSEFSLSQRLIPLGDVPDWGIADGTLTHREGRYFSVFGVDVEAAGREVATWSQPILEPVDRGLIVFLGRTIRSVFHVLAHARTDAGTRDIVEIGPTISCNPANYSHVPDDRRPRFLDILQGVHESDILFDAVHSEEGGRFFHAENRYMVVDVGEDFPLEVPSDYCWITLEQLGTLDRFGNLVNIAARCLASCMTSLPYDVSELATASFR